jgi:hypothetical protein
MTDGRVPLYGDGEGEEDTGGEGNVRHAVAKVQVFFN